MNQKLDLIYDRIKQGEIQSALALLALYETQLNDDELRNKTAISSSVIRAACLCSNVRKELFMSEWRAGKVVPWRQAAAWVLRNRAYLTLPEVGRSLDRHHTTIMHACEKVDECMVKNGPNGPYGAKVTAIWRLAKVLQAHTLDQMGVAA